MNGHSDALGADAWPSNTTTTTTTSHGPGDSRRPASSYPPIAEIIASATDTAESLRHHSVHAGTAHRLVVRR